MLIVLSVAGLLHVLGGSPHLSDPVDVLRDAGGYVGGGVGVPLTAGVGPAGASIVLVAFLALGLLLASGLSLPRVIELAGTGIAKLRELTVHLFKALTETPEGTEAETVPGPVAPAGTRRATLDTVPVEEPELDDEPEPEPAVVLPRAITAPAEPEEPTDIAVVEDDEGQMAIDLTAHGDWQLPVREILKRSVEKEVDHRLVEQGGAVLEGTLRDFGVDAKLAGMTIGPTVTRYELELAAGVKVNRVTALNHDIAYAMASADVRILAPIPGRSAIGVEVPNKQRQLVTLGDILVSTEAKQATHPLQVGLGRDIAGRSFMLNLSEMPHLLIAGQTGAGKSSCINSLITSILMRCTPEQVRLILVDPKRVELGQYNGLPHLLTEVVTNPKKAANALEWTVREMDMRYDLLAEVGVRDISGFNAMYDRGDLPTAENPDPHGDKSYERIPYIVVVIDELNDLMMVAARDVEQSICRIAQMAARRRHPPRDRDPAPVGRRHHRRDQGQRAEPARVLREHPRRLARHPRPARRREADRPWGHVAVVGVELEGAADPGCVGRRGVRAQGRRPLAPPGRGAPVHRGAAGQRQARWGSRRRGRRR